ncbi:hypothetical protein V4F39_22335 [Aquincola sp. MAHUQ-54]|uniref:DUF3379 domain-containing protein n=1 Tax=Aquincola agrisoli TaxID=3119538 RepID=A0AAW9QMM1_9BURK
MAGIDPRDLPDPAPDSGFDLRTRAELALACDPGEPPAGLFRHTPWRRRAGVHRAAVALLATAGVWGAVMAVRPPELVRGAIEHEYYERTLRGSFMAPDELLRHLGLAGQRSAPGYPQLMRPCDIDGQRAYHLTTFFEKGGMVTVLAFDGPVALADGGGWWNNVYWQVIRSRAGKPLVLVAQKKKALAVAQASLGRPPG